jgi:hypothetical protein
VATAEVLESGRDRSPLSPRRRLAAVAVLVVAALVVASVLVDDQRRRGSENDRLDACVAAAYWATDSARARIAGVAGYIRPGLRAGTPPGTADSLYSIVADSAGEAAAVVEPVRRSCAAIEIRGRHVAQLRLRTAVLAYLDLVLESFRATSSNGRQYFERNQTLLLARRAITEAQTTARG